MKTPKRAAIYTRISNDPHDTKLGVRRQEEDARNLAAEKGWGIGPVYSDNDVSAHNGKPRPEYHRLLRDIESGAVDGVIVYHLSRLHRRPAELEAFMTIADAKSIPLASVSGDVDLSTSQGRLVARLMGSVDAHESEVKGERIRRKHLQLAQQGKVVGGGRRPLGYSDDRLHVIADEARMIRSAAKRLAAGDTLYAIAAEWNAKGERTPMGSSWRPAVIKKALCSARVAGQREYLGKLYPAEWPAIIPLAEWTRLRRLLCDPARRSGGGARRRYLGSGLLRCGRCGELLTATRRAGTAKRVFMCNSGPGRTNCGKVSVVADEAEQLVATMVWAALDKPMLAGALRRASRSGEHDDDELLEAIRGDEAQLEELAAQWAEKKMSMPEWMTAREVIEARLRNARARAGADRQTAPVAEFMGKSGALAKAWGGLSVDRRRAIVAAVVDHVDIAPGTRGSFDEDRVHVIWRV